MPRHAVLVLWRAARRFVEHSGPDRAAGIAFYTLLSLLPMLIFVISVAAALYGSFDAAYRGALLLFRGVVLPLDTGSLEALRDFVAQAARLQWPGILLLAWTSRRVFGALLSALEGVFEAPARGFARGNLVSLALVLLAGVALLLTLVATTLLAAFEGLVGRLAGTAGLAAFRGLLVPALAHGVPILTAAAFFFLVYRFFPRRTAAVGAREAAIGSAVATLLWEAAQIGFAYYVRNLAHYGGLYGALEGVIVLALWLELSAAIILYGGEVVAVLTLFPLTPAEPGR